MSKEEIERKKTIADKYNSLCENIGFKDEINVDKKIFDSNIENEETKKCKIFLLKLLKRLIVILLLSITSNLIKSYVRFI